MKVGFILSILLATSVLTGCSMGEDKSKAYAAKKAFCTLDHNNIRIKIVESIKAREEVQKVFQNCLTATSSRYVTGKNPEAIVIACTNSAYEIVGVESIKDILKGADSKKDEVYENVIKCGGK